MNDKQQIDEQIAQLEYQILALKEKKAQIPTYDWDNMNDKEIVHILGSDSKWDTWLNCPVGTLINDGGRLPSDKMLYYLGTLTSSAFDRNFYEFIYNLRLIVRLRLDQLRK